MKQKLNTRIIFWSSTVFLFIFNIVGIVIFRNNIRLSVNSFLATLFFIAMSIRGILACTTKDVRFLLLSRRYIINLCKYNRPTQNQLNDFYIKATLYFAFLPFYLPLAVFSSKNIHTLWCLFLLLAPQIAMVCIEIQKMMVERKERKFKEDLLQKEKEEQEKREELGHWK